MDDELTRARERVTLLDLVDRALDKGVVITGDITLSVANVDLVYLGLRAVLSSAASLEGARGDDDRQQPRGSLAEPSGVSQAPRKHASPVRDH